MNASKPHAPRTGPGYSAGKKPPAVSAGRVPHPRASAGNRTGIARRGDRASAHAGKAADHAMMRKPYG